MISDVISHIKNFAVSVANKVAKASVVAFRKCKEYARACKILAVKLVAAAREAYDNFVSYPKYVKISVLSAVSSSPLLPRQRA